MKALLLLGVFFFTLNSFSQVETSGRKLDEKGLLKKMSWRLNGTPSSLIDRKNLEKAIAAGTTEKFFDELAEQYLASNNFTDKTVEKLKELFGFNMAFSFGLGASENLFRDILNNNLSWDQLLTAKNYKISNADYGFLQKEYDGVTDYIGDNRFAGAITTFDFMSRYANTGINKSRRRAAAIYRIFLCDSMKLAVAGGGPINEALLKKYFSQNHVNNLQNELNQSALAQHGTDQACAKCHVKLDPLASGMAFITNRIGDFSSSGELRIPRAKSNGSLQIDPLPFSNMNELGQIISQQPEYRSCQVGNFLRWFVGYDVPLSPERRTEIENSFDSLGRRPKDFVKYLVKQPEFKLAEVSSIQDDIVKVKSSLKRCDNCHSNVGFSKWPIGGTQMEFWVERIATRTDLKNDGLTPTMPPATAQWILSPDEVKAFKRWIKAGAPDVDMKENISKETIEKILEIQQ